MNTNLRTGKVAITHGVNEMMKESTTFLKFVKASLIRYINGDWGDTCEDDKRQNDWAVGNGERILAAYSDENGTKIWIITEWDRSYTTILLPDEY